MNTVLENFSFIVYITDNKLRLDKFLAIQLPQLSRSKIKQLILKGKVKINDLIIADASFLVKSHDVISIEIPTFIGEEISARPIEFEILYEDRDLLVINKPAGLTVHPGSGNKDNTLVNGLLMHCGNELSNISSDRVRPGILHRLDKDTSGVLIVAKNNRSHLILSSDLAERKIKRTYMALVYKVPSHIYGTIKTQYGRCKNDKRKFTIKRDGGKTAITRYKIIKTYGDAAVSLLECLLETGRTHQIRVHLTHKGTPIIGDQVYGKDKNFNLNSLPSNAKDLIKQLKRQALHAYSISFTHPSTLEELSFSAPPPEDMQDILDELNLS
jgi:23S rRNA pseudouridine1911/1915/1917 synthase